MNEKSLKPFFKIFYSTKKNIEKEPIELFFNEHFEEIRQRCFQLIFIFCCFVSLAFINIKFIVDLLEVPIKNVRFFQLSPGEYFLSTLKISFYTGIVTLTPLVLGQIIFFFVPGLNFFEKKTTIYLLVASIILFFLGLNFSYFILIPAALKFFINYGLDIIEPIWSFNQYYSFISVLFISTALIFQVPIVQIILSTVGFVDPQKMLSVWKLVALFSTIIGAILTPSVDPTTQILLSGALFFLYLCGAYVSIVLTKKFR